MHYFIVGKVLLGWENYVGSFFCLGFKEGFISNNS